MLECMHSLTKRSRIKDYEYEFYDKYLSNYSNIEFKDGYEKVTQEDAEIFASLNNIYSSCNSLSADERTTEQKLSDSFAFYVSTGVIVLSDSNYYIDLKKLQKYTKQYENINGIEDIAYSKGAK